ncbi:hypothetical protein [uncultured Chryseobacterium sp.]|uniref:hypothetical protein n=1 Tax=uncultured Chryseobacterium sp. TaxID=259322 RepID=UPI00258719B6|nr:hypothetical protein [uncultured Chryseobacterium sp.]
MKFEELMYYIERRPQQFIGEKNIFLLNAFLTGYLYNDSIRLGERADYDFRSDFNDWLQNKFNYHNSFSWSNIINEISQKENLNAIDVFFREYHLFKKRK